MFTVVCFFRVNKNHLEEFLDVTTKSGNILIAHGALDHRIFRPEELTGKQGSMGLLNFIEVSEEEELMFGQTIFRDEAHYHEVMAHVSSDDLIHYLKQYLKEIVEMDRVVTSTFTS
ncbi:DUF1428 family protein [Thalassobacillus sp. CUG 92003]|uniref:DUF1428 family protein n=1 Tax=Thalassobacillus sp. CUG 92003 TaxID=2736641 RepID=UPI0015E70938|nr:DUF1428 family protein [Thalassobacillus sp. CUG 92003]